MTISVRKLSTNDMLIFDRKNYESYIVKPNKTDHPSDDLLSMAKELVANGQGIHLTRAGLNQLQHATNSIYLLT